VLSIVGDESGCSLWRAWQPARFLRLHGYPCDWVHVRDPSLVNVPLEGYEAIVLCRLAWHQTDRKRAGRWLDTLRKKGRRVFFEADDDLFTPFMTEQQLGRINPEKSRQELEADRAAALWALARCDGVTVSTQYLASTVRRYTSAPVEVVPNAIDAEWFLARQLGVPRPCPNVTIGWAGGNRPDADLEPMAVAWGRIARRYPEVMFVVFGHQPPVVAAHVPDERVIRISWLPSQDYPRGMVGVDVGCCPLDDTPFNRSKTAIKAFEFALSGAAVVASPTVYGKVIDSGRSGWVCEDQADWDVALAKLVEWRDTRRYFAENLKAEVLERWSLKANYWRWPAAWQRLMGA
jgi:hypothetical protein